MFFNVPKATVVNTCVELLDVPEACPSLGRYIDGFYNTNRPHSSIDNKTPDEAYFNKLSPISLAA